MFASLHQTRRGQAAGLARFVAAVNEIADAALPVLETFFWLAWLVLIVRAMA